MENKNKEGFEIGKKCYYWLVVCVKRASYNYLISTRFNIFYSLKKVKMTKIY